MKRTKNLALFLLVSVLTAGTLGGCQKPAGGTDAQDAEVQADTGAAAGDKKDTLRVALTAEPPSLTTCDHDSLISVGLNMLTYNGLVRIDNATLKPVLDLASDYNANWLENIYYLSNQRRLFMKCSDKVKTILIEGKLQQGKGIGYEKWAKTLIYLQEHGLDDYEVLSEKTEDAGRRFDMLSDKIKASEKRLQRIHKICFKVFAVWYII